MANNVLRLQVGTCKFRAIYSSIVAEAFPGRDFDAAAFDFDGTLAQHGGHVSEETIAHLMILRRLGKGIAIVTGRGEKFHDVILGRLAPFRPDYLSYGHGAVNLFLNKDNEYELVPEYLFNEDDVVTAVRSAVRRYHQPIELARAVAVLSQRVAVEYPGAQLQVGVERGTTAGPAFLSNGFDWPYTEDTGIERLPIPQLIDYPENFKGYVRAVTESGIIACRAHVLEHMAHIAFKENNVNVELANAGFDIVELLPRGVNKDHARRQIRAHSGWHKLVGAGDNTADAGLYTPGTLFAFPSNASPELKALMLGRGNALETMANTRSGITSGLLNFLGVTVLAEPTTPPPPRYRSLKNDIPAARIRTTPQRRRNG